MDPIHVFVPNFPPPPIPQHLIDGESIPTQTSNASTRPNSQLYKDRLKNYLKSRQNRTSLQISSEKPQQKFKLCDVSKDLSHCYDLIEQIHQEIDILSQTASSISKRQWNDRIIDLKTQTTILTSTCSKYQNINSRFEVKSLVDRRLKKRDRIRKRKAETKALKLYEAKNRELKHQQIDQLLEQNAEKIRENRHQIENKQRAEEILTEVKSRKNDANKYLMVLDSLKTLYRIRNRDRPSNSIDEAAFYREIEQLKEIWLNASETYATEEKELSKFLPGSNHWVEWRDIIFGEPTQADILFALKKSDNGLNQLIQIRRLWDKCCVSDDNPFGSRIPFGWVIPNENPSEPWKAFVKHD